MTRRIAAGILTLLLLMNLALPAGAADTTDDTVYPIGYKDMWVVGLETVPTAKTEYPGEWRPVYKEDGITRVSQPGKCPEHACDTSCYDTVGNKTCGVAVGEEHRHNIKCAVEATIKYATYQWQVVDPTANGNQEGTEPQDTQPIGTEPPEEEFNDGSAYLYVYNVGVDGAKLSGTEFLLLEERVEEDPSDPEKTVINEYVKGYAQTNEEGIALLKGLRLTGDATEATWKLVQDRLPTDLENTFVKTETRWDVTIVRNEDGTHTLTGVKPEGFETTDADGNEITYEAYNGETKTLTVENELLLGAIFIDVEFEGFENALPEGAGATVTVTIPGAEPTVFEFPNTQTRYILQQAQLTELKMGTYSLTASAPGVVDGYSAEGPTIQLQCPVDGTPTNSDTVTLNAEHSYAKFTITYRYTVECDHVYTEVVVPPTCTSDGYTLFTCECGANYTEEGDPATGHNHQPVVSAPTCTVAGYTTYTCINSNCEHSYREDGAAATGHNYDVTEFAPTCTEKGYTAYTCINENCEHSYREEKADPIGHKYEDTVVPPTCTEKGYTNHVCVNEGCEYSYQDTEVDATGHKYEDTVEPPTCTKKGYTNHVCVNEGCEYSYQDTEVDAIGHKYKDTVVPPTCTEKGYTNHACVNAGCAYSEKIDEIPATGHDWTPATCTAPKTCNTCGTTEGKELGHDMGEWVITKEATCTGEGERTRCCKRENCDYSETGVVIPSGHSYENGICLICNEKETKPESSTESNKGTATVKQSNIIVVRAVDDLGNPLENTQIGLYNDKKAVRTWSATYDNVFVLDDLEKLVSDGESATYTLKQTKAPAGHHLASATYTVTVSRKNGDAKVDVKKNAGSMGSLFKGSGVEMGTDGKQIVTFVNERKTTLIELKCETIVDFAKGSWEDEALIEECRKASYQFILAWEDAEGERQEETVTVTGEEAAVLEAEIPYGADYELTALDEDGSYVIMLSENCEGTVDAEQIRGNIEITATRTYTVEPGDPITLNLTKVDADSKRPLTGVEFSLKNGKGIELATYASDENGDFAITDVLTEPGNYTLEETKTVDGYQLLPVPVRIEVTVEYVLDEAANAPAFVQIMTARLTSTAVVEESDGSFWIENDLIQEEPQEEEPGGMGIGAIVGICVAGAAGLAGLSLLLIRRRRRGR